MTTEITLNISPDSIADHDIFDVVAFYRAAAARDWPGAEVCITTDKTSDGKGSDPIDAHTGDVLEEGWSNEVWTEYCQCAAGEATSHDDDVLAFSTMCEAAWR